MAIQISGTTVINDTRYLTNTRNQTSVISTNTTAVSSQTYIITAALTLTLPASPTAGDYVGVSKRTTGAVTIARNAQNIMSLAENMTVDVDDAGFRLVFTDATRGWVIV
jgi:hypothetical protein